MTQQAPYKPDRFDQAVDHYVAARSRYAPELINWLADVTHIAGGAVRLMRTRLSQDSAAVFYAAPRLRHALRVAVLVSLKWSRAVSDLSELKWL